MAEHTIPVNLYNPGQVFASLGFLEAADLLLGNAEGGFDWSDPDNVIFKLNADGDVNPVAAVLEFLAEAEPRRWMPRGYVDGAPEKGDAGDNDDDGRESEAEGIEEPSTTFPAGKGDRMSLPIRLGGGNRPIVELGHWTDGSDRNSFKLYSGNRSAEGIARARLQTLRVDARQIGGERPLPVAVVGLLQAVVGAEILSPKAQHAAHDLHGFARAGERARYIVGRGDGGQQGTQRLSVALGLRAPARVHGDIGLALVAGFRIPLGLAVADEIDRYVRAHRFRQRERASRILAFHHGNVGRVLVLHALDVVAGVDVMHLAGHSPRQVRQQIEAGGADLLDGHRAPERRVVLVPPQDIAEVGDAGGGKCLDRAG